MAVQVIEIQTRGSDGYFWRHFACMFVLTKLSSSWSFSSNAIAWLSILEGGLSSNAIAWLSLLEGARGSSISFLMRSKCCHHRSMWNSFSFCPRLMVRQMHWLSKQWIILLLLLLFLCNLSHLSCLLLVSSIILPYRCFGHHCVWVVAWLSVYALPHLVNIFGCLERKK